MAYEISPEAHFTQFWPIWPILGHFWVHRVLQNCPHSFLTFKNIKI